jgi:4-hydroxybenzoate polyprenyltransferase
VRSRSLIAHLAGLARLVHPFPSALDAVAAAAVALVAGAAMAVALRLALGMLLLQFAIGAANDVVDLPRDLRSRRSKPIPLGRVTTREAVALVAIATCVGLAAAASVGLGAVAVGIAGLAVGLLYDVWLKGTAFSWLPFAAGVALLPIYAWVGSTGTLTSAFWAIIPLALIAGAALAAANSVADLESDREAGVSSVAMWLGRRGSLVAGGVALGLVQLAVVVSTALSAVSPVVLFAELTGIALGWVGLRLNAARNDRLARLGWEVEAVGIVSLGIGWLVALASAGSL